MNQNDYIKHSLELHLFFDRIMKEHSFFIEVVFPPKDNELKKIARGFQKSFSDILEEVVALANNSVSQNFLDAKEIVTDNTLKAKMQTSSLSGIMLDTNITQKEMNLNSGNNININLISNISSINRQTLPLIQRLINFKNDILNGVLACKMYTSNYPLLITHIMNEAKMYYNLLSKIEKKRTFYRKLYIKSRIILE